MQTQRAILTRELSRHGGIAVEEQRDGGLLGVPEGERVAGVLPTSVQRACARIARNTQRNRSRCPPWASTPASRLREGGNPFLREDVIPRRVHGRSRADANDPGVSTVAHDLAEPTGEFHFDDGELTELEGLSGVVESMHSPGPRTAPRKKKKERFRTFFRREGDYWAGACERSTRVRMKDAKGMQYIAALLRRQGEEVPTSAIS